MTTPSTPAGRFRPPFPAAEGQFSGGCTPTARKVFGDFPALAMDSDDEEVLATLLEEEAEADVQEEEHLMVLAALTQLLASNEKPRRGGSVPGRVKAKNRHRLEGYCMLYSDYFADAPLHDDKIFRRRYRMSRKLFLGIVNSIREFDNYFKCKMDCTGALGFTSIQKCTTAMRMLAYGAPGDSQDD